jgi:predicted nucleic acid-binding protein
MKRLRIYVDTSVIGGCLDEEFVDESRALLQMAREGLVKLLVSDVLADELELAPKDVQDIFGALPQDCLEAVFRSEETERLRDGYLAAKVVNSASVNDAHHVALATIGGADMIVSWNFKHIVHFEKIRGFNAVNLREGYTSIEIRSPREVV